MGIELEQWAKNERAKEKECEFESKLFDAHMATLEMLVHNANFRRPLKVADFKLIGEQKAVFPASMLAIDAKLRAQAQERIRAKRAQNVFRIKKEKRRS